MSKRHREALAKSRAFHRSAARCVRVNGYARVNNVIAWACRPGPRPGGYAPAMTVAEAVGAAPHDERPWDDPARALLATRGW